MISRRFFVSHTLAAVPLLACRSPIREAAARDASVSSGESCPAGIATEVNIEGPYYRSGAPFRSDLVSPGIVGTPFVISGTVLSLDCRSPLSDAVLDVWQADGTGHYDNDGSTRGDAMRLRGKIKVGSGGAFSFKSVLPGRYLNGAQYRPAHVHVKVSAAGHVPLTTQLYFPGDPYNDVDPFIKKSLIMDVSNALGRYDFVLVPKR